MNQVIFFFNRLKIMINCNITDNIEKICKEFALILERNINEFSFSYNLKELNLNSTFKDYRTKEDDEKEIMNILVNDKEYFNKNNYKFKENPNLRHVTNISNNKNGSYIFDVFTSLQDCKEYIIVKNINDIDIYTLLDYKKVKSLKGHNTGIVTVKYFINNKDYKEYFISTDYNKMVIIWDISNDYNILLQINTPYKELIFNCLLIFPHNKEDNYMAVCANMLGTNYFSILKIFSLKTGNIVKESQNPMMIKNFNILSWYNKNNDEYYIVKLDYGRIQIINLLDNEIYSTFVSQNNDIYYDGIIYNKNKIDFLCTVSNNGYVDIWDLFNKQIYKNIYIENCNLNRILSWNDKYFICNDYHNNSFKLINIENNKVISNIKINTENILCLKKIKHPIYGESLLFSGNDNIIKSISVN